MHRRRDHGAHLQQMFLLRGVLHWSISNQVRGGGVVCNLFRHDQNMSVCVDTAAEPLEGLLTATDHIELDIDVALRRSRIYGDVNHFSTEGDIFRTSCRIRLLPPPRGGGVVCDSFLHGHTCLLWGSPPA